MLIYCEFHASSSRPINNLVYAFPISYQSCRRQEISSTLSADTGAWEQRASAKRNKRTMCNNDFNVWKICLKQTDPTMRKRFAFNFLSRLPLPDAQSCAGAMGVGVQKKKQHRKYEKIRYNLWFVYSKAKAGWQAKSSFIPSHPNGL